MLVPFRHQHRLLLRHDAHRLAKIPRLEAVAVDQLGPAVGSRQVDLRLAIADHMDMRWRVIVDEDDESPASRCTVTMAPDNLSAWVFQRCPNPSPT